MTYGRVVAAFCFVAFLADSAIAAAPEVPAFSAMRPGGPIAGWQVLKPAPKANDTRYSVVIDAGKAPQSVARGAPQSGDRAAAGMPDHAKVPLGRPHPATGSHLPSEETAPPFAVAVLKAEAEHAMSGLIHPVRVDIRQYPLLRWHWKIAAPLKSADMTQKSGDDYAARIYVMFDYPMEKLSFGTRTKLRLAEALYGHKIPTATLNYVWDNRQPVGTIQPNTYTDRARMIVLQSGAAQAGQWVTETRDLVADFRAAFGEDPPDVVAIALATDTDNTGESTVAWYGDIEFLPRAAATAP